MAPTSHEGAKAIATTLASSFPDKIDSTVADEIIVKPTPKSIEYQVRDIDGFIDTYDTSVYLNREFLGLLCPVSDFTDAKLLVLKNMPNNALKWTYKRPQADLATLQCHDPRVAIEMVMDGSTVTGANIITDMRGKQSLNRKAPNGADSFKLLETHAGRPHGGGQCGLRW